MADQSVIGSVEQRVALARNRKTSQEKLYSMVADPSAQVRAALAARPDATAQMLRALTRDRDRGVREIVARNAAASQGDLLRLLGDADRRVRWAVATNPSCDERIRGVMVKAQDKELRGLLAEMPALEPDFAAELVGDASPEVRERLAAHTAIPEIIDALLEDRAVRVRKGLAVNEWTSPDQRHRLATDFSPEIRATLVSALDLEEADLRGLLDDRSADVRQAMAASDRTPQHIREALMADADEQVRRAALTYRASEQPPAAGAPAEERKVAPRTVARKPVARRFPGKNA